MSGITTPSVQMSRENAAPPVASSGGRARCRHCGRLVKRPRRRLCDKCRRDHEVVALYAADWRPWTAPECKLLSKFAAEGADAAEIAEAVGRPEQAVRRKASRLGVRLLRPLDRVKRSALVRELAKGVSVAEAARQVRRPGPSVHSMVRRMAAEGVVVRLGGATSSCRYVPA